MLFSEPKIPQLCTTYPDGRNVCSFSALQRAENSSIQVRVDRFADQRRVSVLFSEPKIPQYVIQRAGQRAIFRFSALQRAENSSIEQPHGVRHLKRLFQCSSASRKFLNGRGRSAACCCKTVSVLFSEPKIPQFIRLLVLFPIVRPFQCSSASRKFLNNPGTAG